MEFNIFGKADISRQKELIAESQAIIAQFNRTQFEEAISDEVFGNKPCYNHINSFYYLIVLLLIIDFEMKTDISNGNMAPWYDKRYYINKYSLENVRKHFKCIGFDISPLLSLIGLGTTEVPTGIDYMYVEGNPDDNRAEEFVVS